MWDVASRRTVALLQGHTAWVFSVAFSPDGKLLASGSDDGTVKLWDVAAAIAAGSPPPPPVRVRPALPPAKPVARGTPPGPPAILMRWLRIHEAWGLPGPRPLEPLALLERLVLFLSDFAGPERKRGQFVFPWQTKVECLVQLARTGSAYGCEKVLRSSRDGKARAEVLLRRYRDAKPPVGLSRPIGMEQQRLAKVEEDYWRSVVLARDREERAFALVDRLVRALRPGPVFITDPLGPKGK